MNVQMTMNVQMNVNAVFTNRCAKLPWNNNDSNRFVSRQYINPLVVGNCMYVPLSVRYHRVYVRNVFRCDSNGILVEFVFNQ